METEQDRQNTGNCDNLREVIPAYVFGAADPDEVALIEARMDECPELLADIADYETLADAMLYSVPQYQPPAHLHDNLMKAIAPPAETSTPAAAKPPIQVLPQPFYRRYSSLAAAVAILLLVVTNIYWMNTVDDLQQENDSLLQQIDPPNSDQLIRRLGGANFTSVDLGLSESSSGSDWALAWVKGTEDNSWVAWCTLNALPTLASEEVYQLWLVRENEAPQSVGVLLMNDDGIASIVFEIGEPIGSFDLLWITVEPPGGSEEPTSPPVLDREL